MSALTQFTDISTSAVAATQLAASYPIAGDVTAVIYSQDYTVPFANYVAPTLSSANADVATAYCIGDSELEDIGAGIARYTRQWATIPANRNEWGSFAYQFPGLLGSSNPPYSQYWTADIGGGRDPVTLPAKSRIYHEYFLCAAGQTYTTPGDIPAIEKTRFSLASNLEATIVYLLPASVYWSDSVPTKEAYQAMIAAEDELVAEDSFLERYAGEIYVRRTRYVIAQ